MEKQTPNQALWEHFTWPWHIAVSLLLLYALWQLQEVKFLCQMNRSLLLGQIQGKQMNK